MFYTLFITFIISGEIHEAEMKTYERFEECAEAAEILTRNRQNITARCVLVEKPKENNK